MTCADYHAWQGAIRFGAEMILVLMLMALVVYMSNRPRP